LARETGSASGTADAVLVAKHLLKIGAHLVTALGRLHVLISREEAAWNRGERGRKKAGRSGEI
jgi:hypothetical protein